MTTGKLQTQPLMSVDEFFAWDGGGHQGKLELIDGVVRAMAPASATHAIIQGNLVAALHAHLRSGQSRCRVAPEAPIQPLALRSKGNVRVPDVAVVCGPPSSSRLFERPVLIIEVLSPSGEDETWESIRALAPLTTLPEIVTVWSTRIEIEIYRRGDDANWMPDPGGPLRPGVVRLQSVGLDLPIEEIYGGTHPAVSEGAS